MAKLYQYQTPDTFQQHLKYRRDREMERKAQLDAMDEERDADVQRRMQIELQRKTALDARDMEREDDYEQRMETERKRSQWLDAQEARQRRQEEMYPTRPAPEEPGIDRTLRNVFRTAGQVLAPGLKGAERDVFLPAPEGLAPPLPRSIGAAQTAMRAPEFSEEFGWRFRENLGIRMETMERRNRERAASGLPPLTEEGEREAAYQHTLDTMRSKEEVTPLSLGLGALEAGDYPRRLLKEKVIEPAVPGFEFTIPKEVQIATGRPPQAAEDVTITSGMVEEAASWILDPANALPAIGFGPDLLRAAKAATKGSPAALRKLLKNPEVRRFMKTASSEAGGRAKPPIRVEEPVESMNAKIASYVRRSEKLQPEIEAGRHLETVERAAALETEKNRLLAQGVPYEAAVKQASAKLRGKKFTKPVGRALKFTDEEAAAFGNVIETRARTYEKVRLLVDEPEKGRLGIFTKMLTRQPVTPAEASLLRRLFGDEVADAALALGRTENELRRALEEAYGAGRIPIKRTVPRWGEEPIFEGGMVPLEYEHPGPGAAAFRRAQEEAYGIGARPIPRMVPGAETPRIGTRRFEGAIPEGAMRETGMDVTLARQAARDKAKMLKDLEKSYPVKPRVQREVPVERALPETQLGVPRETKITPAVKKAAKEPALATRILDEILEIPRFFTGLYSLLDASVGGRQLRMLATGFFGGRRAGGRLPVSARLPRVWARAYWDSTSLMFRSGETRAAYRASLRQDPTVIRVWTPDGHEEMAFGKLWTDVGGRLKPDEIDERVVSNILRKLPGFKQSAEGFEIGLEAAHHSALKDELLNLAATGQRLTMKDVRALSEATTALTGRGNLGKNLLADIATALGWAPRLRVAFWQSLFRLGHPNAHVRSLAARRVAGYLGTGLTMMGVAETTGAGEVTWNPLDTDFGKIKIKGIRFNVWGPDVVAMRYLAQGIMGYASSPLTGKYKVDWKNSLMRYARSGANPAVGLFIDWRTGKTYTGEPFDLLRWQERLPLAFQDIVDAFELKGGGLLGAAYGAAVAPFVGGGIGVQSYDRPEDRLARAYNEEVDAGTFGKGALYYADEEDLTVKANVQKVAELVQLDTERNLLHRAENIEVKKGLEDQYGLPETARRFSGGDTAVGPQLMKDWRAYRHDSHVAMDARVFGVEFPETEDGKLLHEWLSIDSHDEKYRDPITREPDYDLVGADSDAAKARLVAKNPRLAAAVEEIISSVDPGLQKIEPDLEEALALRSDLYDLPRWKPEVKNQKQIDRIHKLVDRKNTELADRGLPDVPMERVYQEVAGDNPQLSKELLGRAYHLRPSSATSKRYRNPEYQALLEKHADRLQDFFPDLYPEELRARMAVPTRAGTQADPLAGFRTGGTTGAPRSPTTPTTRPTETAPLAAFYAQ